MSRVIVALAAFSVLSLVTASADAQSWTPPTDAERCPSKWGAADERGAANLMKPEVVVRAARLIKTGEVIELAHPLFAGMPFYGDRVFSQQLKRTNGPLGSNNRGSNEEMVTTELGQVGTQIDGFGHQSIGNSLYNCFKMDELATRTGFSKLGIEKAGAMFTRGVLIDVAGLRGVEMLGDRYEITARIFKTRSSARISRSRPVTRSSSTQDSDVCGGKTTCVTTARSQDWASEQPSGSNGRIR